MAQYIFTPITDILSKETDGLYGNKLYFQLVANNYNYSPFAEDNYISTNFLSVVKPGQYVYPLTRAGSIASIPNSDTSERLYPLDNLKTVKVTDVIETNGFAEVTLSSPLQAPVLGNTGVNAQYDYFLFDTFFNKTNQAKIGIDRKPAQQVETLVSLYDQTTSSLLVDQATNPLFTTDKTFFDEALKTINATSVVVNNPPSDSIKVEELFPTSSEVASSLLGVPRGEEQLSLFSDVSTLGLDSQTWESFSYRGSDRATQREWEERATTQKEGNRYNGKIIENIAEQAIELSSNPVPYGYPFPAIDTRYHRGLDGPRAPFGEFQKYKNFIILGNMLFLHFKGTGKETAYLDPNHVRWGRIGGYNFINGQLEQNYEFHQFGNNISEEVAFLYIDTWTRTWIDIKNEVGIVDTSFINNIILNSFNNYPLREALKAEYLTLNRNNNSITQAEANTNATAANTILTNHFSSGSEPLVFTEASSNGTMPGYSLGTEYEQVVLQSKEVYRYQPGRISGFTFGSRTNIASGSGLNYAEWGCVNETDEYLFRLSEGKINIVRRSTVKLSDESLARSGGLFPHDQKEFENSKPLYGGKVRPKFYETIINQSQFNGDPLDGSGLSNYKLDPQTVTMWKIEFSWYGAIGVQFYAYVPTGTGEARWVKLHRIIIENLLGRANLEDPYFRMRYNLVIGNKTITTEPQFVYKYGSSVYVDGGDEGTKTQTSFKSALKVVPEDSDIPGDMAPGDKFLPMLGLRNRTQIKNRDGIARPSRIIAIPETLNVTCDQLIEVDIVETTGGPDGFGFVYENGLRWNPNASPALKTINNSPAYSNFPTGTTNQINEGGADLSPYSSQLFDFVFTPDTLGKVYKLSLVKPGHINASPTARTKSGVIPEFPRTFQKLSSADTPLMIDSSFDDAKIFVPGLNNCYIDWDATISDSTITKYSGSSAGTRPGTDNLVGEIRFKQINRHTSMSDIQQSRIDGTSITNYNYRKNSVNASKPLFTIPKSGAYFRSGNQNTASGWNNKFSLANPKFPDYKSRLARPPYNDSPSRTLVNQFTYDFGQIYSAGNSPFKGLVGPNNFEITDPSSVFFPYRFFGNGAEKDYYILKTAFQSYDLGVGQSDFCVPYSYGFAMTKLQKWNQATATTDESFSGESVTMRFLNPHAGGVGIIKNPFTGGGIAEGKYPEFRIGFTNRVPALKNMDGSSVTIGSGNNMKWNGKFESPGGEGILDDKDFIYADYTAKSRNFSKTVGEFERGEFSFTNAKRMQNDYRLRGILDEGKRDSSGNALDYHIGGMPSYVRLEVAKDYTEYLSIDYVSGFSNIISTYNGSGSFTTYTSDQRILFPEYPDAYLDGAYQRADFDGELSTQSADDQYLILRDYDKSFSRALKQGLEIKGGGVTIRTTAGGVPQITNIKFVSAPIEFKYYTDSAGTGINDQGDSGITLSNFQSAYLIQIDGDLESALGGITLDNNSSLLFKIVNLFFPDGIDGTEETQVQKVFADSSTNFYPVVKLREDAIINNIDIKVERPAGPPTIISPIWKLYGAMEIAKPLVSNSPGFARMNNSDDAADGVASSIPPSFFSKNRLDGLESNSNTNKVLRKSVSDPLFVAKSNDAIAYKRFVGSGSSIYDYRGRLAENAKKITSYYFGSDTAGKSLSKEIDLSGAFGEDRNKLLPDVLGTKVTFIRAQKVNIEDTAETANVQLSVNVSQI